MGEGDGDHVKVAFDIQVHHDYVHHVHVHHVHDHHVHAWFRGGEKAEEKGIFYMTGPYICAARM